MLLDFKQLVDPNRNVIADPLSHYKVSDIDDTSDPQFYGSIAHDGHWYIMKINTVDKTYRYVAGGSSYADAWANRTSLGYDYFHSMF